MSRIESPDNRVLQEDLERAAALDLPIEALDGSRIFVTGATGLIGSQPYLPLQYDSHYLCAQ